MHSRCSSRYFAILFLVIIFSLSNLLYSLDDKQLYLSDGLSVLDYICTGSLFSGKQLPVNLTGQFSMFLQGVGNAIFGLVYPSILHCDTQGPPFFAVGLVNFLLTLSTLRLLRPYLYINLLFLITPLALSYQCFSLFVASKEAFLVLLATSYSVTYLNIAVFYVPSLRSYLPSQPIFNHSRLTLCFFLNISSVFLMGYVRPTYALLLLPTFIFLFYPFIRNSHFTRLTNFILTGILLIILFVPFLLTFFPLDMIAGDANSTQYGMTSVYLSRYSTATADSDISSLADAFTAPGIFKRLLSMAFSYRHVLLSLYVPPFNPGSFLAYLGTKLSVAFSIIFILVDLFLFLRVLCFFLFYRKPRFCFEPLLITLIPRIIMLNSVLLYPFPHERYMLPFVIGTFILRLNPLTSRAAVNS